MEGYELETPAPPLPHTHPLKYTQHTMGQEGQDNQNKYFHMERESVDIHQLPVHKILKSYGTDV